MKPSLLIASPQLRDPFFERTVVLLWHHDADGAVGVVVNRPLEQTLPEVLTVDDDVDLSGYAATHLRWGGPVETETGTVVTRGPVSDDEGWLLDHGIAVTRSQEALLRLIEGGEHLLLCLGYAGWGPGQLDDEIAKGGWLFTDLSPDVLFAGESETIYDRALATLGLTAHTVWMQPIDE